MTRGLIFWVLMLVWLVFGLATYGGFIHLAAIGTLLQFVLFALLGWQVYGPAIK